MTSGDDWKEWASDFKALEVDVPAISRKARRSGIELGVEIAVASVTVPAAVALIVWKMARAGSTHVLVAGGLGMAILAFSCVAFFRLRRGAFAAERETPAGLLELTMRQERARLRESRLSSFVVAAVAAAYGLWRICAHLSSRGDLLAEAWQAMVVFAVAGLGLVFLRLYARKKRRALSQLEELARSFHHGAGSP